MSYDIQKQIIALGRGLFMPGYVVLNDGRFDEWFKYPEQARHYVERKQDELTRDG